MAIRHVFEFGTAVLALDNVESVRTSDLRNPLNARSVRLFVKNPGDLFKVGRLQMLQKRIEKVVEGIPGTSLGVVNLHSITLYDRSIRTYEDGLAVATDLVEGYKEMMEQFEKEHHPTAGH